MKTFFKKLYSWLERHWVSPAYGGGLLLVLALFFFGAATNTMAGWLYLISGVSLVILLLGAILPPRSLRQLHVRRHPISPVSAGDRLTLEMTVENRSSRPQTLLEFYDLSPVRLGEPPRGKLEYIDPQQTYRWLYELSAAQRGIYYWHEVQLRSAAPLGLFWCRRSRQVPAKAIVYPTVLPLSRCPLIDNIGRENVPLLDSRDRHSQLSAEGLTRALRPYRWGDPTRLIHWRTSARYGELRVRELETFSSGQEVAICLDSGENWEAENFEQAAIAAASLYFYAIRAQVEVQFWSPKTGSIRGHQVVLEALADATPNEEKNEAKPPSLPIVWLTQNPNSLRDLPSGSRWLLWADRDRVRGAIASECPGIALSDDRPLELHLQSSLSAIQ